MCLLHLYFQLTLYNKVVRAIEKPSGTYTYACKHTHKEIHIYFLPILHNRFNTQIRSQSVYDTKLKRSRKKIGARHSALYYCLVRLLLSSSRLCRLLKSGISIHSLRCRLLHIAVRRALIWEGGDIYYWYGDFYYLRPHDRTGSTTASRQTCTGKWWFMSVERRVSLLSFSHKDEWLPIAKYMLFYINVTMPYSPQTCRQIFYLGVKWNGTIETSKSPVDQSCFCVTVTTCQRFCACGCVHDITVSRHIPYI